MVSIHGIALQLQQEYLALHLRAYPHKTGILERDSMTTISLGQRNGFHSWNSIAITARILALDLRADPHNTGMMESCEGIYQ